MLNEILNVDNLSNDELFELIFDVIALNSLENQKEADILINYLTNHPTPLREAVAYKIEELISLSPQFFKNDLTEEKFLNAISDINPNVSRIICDIIASNDFVSGMLTKDIIARIDEIILNIRQYEKENSDFFQNKIKNKKNHKKNKLLFSLYWYLEALSNCNITEHEEEVLQILNFTIDFCDYTIREKTAKLLNKLPHPPYEILQKAKSDQNFYVKIQVHDKITFGD